MLASGLISSLQYSELLAPEKFSKMRQKRGSESVNKNGVVRMDSVDFAKYFTEKERDYVRNAELDFGD